MKEKIKKLLKGNGSLTLLSIISLLTLFFVVCVMVLSIVYRAGIIEFPFDSKTSSETDEPFLPSSDGGNKNVIYSDLNTKENNEKLISSFPYYNDFYAEFYITYIYESYNIEFYRVYKHSDKYRIEIYDAYNEMKKKIICDGTRVAITDYISISSAMYASSDEFSFEEQVPLPYFSMLGTEKYFISEYSEEGGKCTVKCDFPSLSMYDIVNIDMSTGIMDSARTYFNDNVVMYYDIKEFNVNYIFNELVFLT